MIDEKYGSKTTNDKHNKFYRVGQWPLNHVVAGGDDDSLVQNIEGVNSFVGIPEEPVTKVQVFFCKTDKAHNQKPDLYSV